MELSLPAYKTPPDRSKRILFTLLKGGLSGGVLGYLFAVLLGRSVWLEMRLNLGLMIPGCALGCMLLHLWKKITIRYSIFLFLELLSLMIFFLIYRSKPDALLVIPACLFREGCSLTSISLDLINIILGFILFAGNFIWIFHEIGWKLRRRVSC